MAKHLTPDQRAAIVARYQEIANASQVAREFGVSEAAVRKILASADGAKKSELHARAVAQAIRKARRSLARKVDTIDLYLLKHAKNDPDGVPDLEPRDIAALVNASAAVLSRLLETEQRIEAKLTAKLLREHKRAEIELAKLKIKAGGVDRHELVFAGILDGLSRLAGDGSADSDTGEPEG